MIYLIILTIYLLSVFAVYKWIQIAHYNKNGIYNGTEPDDIDIKFTFIPLFNTIMGIGFWFGVSPIKKNKTNFFKPKNYDKNP